MFPDLNLRYQFDRISGRVFIVYGDERVGLS